MKKILVVLTLSLLALVTTAVPRNSAIASVDAPANLTTAGEDTSTVLSWNGGESLTVAKPQGVSGYKITWGLKSSPSAHAILTAYRVIQLQPLVPGDIYEATVQAVDNHGNLSLPSAPVDFSTDNTRVVALKQQMTGFFDDFNQPMGPYDELKWNTAYSTCNDPKYSGMFINDQSHAHNMIAATNCDRGQSISRPRAVFDFTNRTGTIVFDFDGEFRRNQWYLDLVPYNQDGRFMDITGQINIESGQGYQNPGDFIRIHQTDQAVEIIYIDKTGAENTIAKQDFNPWAPLDWQSTPMSLVPNVRRHWKIQVSQASVSVFVNDVKVLETPQGAVNLSYSRVIPLWNEFSYNTPKSNEPYVLVHWDNFGFDGPPSTVETHNYRADGAVNASDYQLISSNNQDVTAATSKPFHIKVQDPVNGATQARLMYTLQMSQNQVYSWSSSDQILINGTVIPMPKPVEITGTEAVGIYAPYSDYVPIPPGLIATGDNYAAFKCQSCGVGNVHVELDFPKGSAPPFTQPTDGQMIMTTDDVPPGAQIYAVGDTFLNLSGKVDQQQPITITGTTLGNTLFFHVNATNDIELQAKGKNTGISRVEFQVDKSVVFSETVNLSPSYDSVISVTALPGTHEYFFAAYSQGGTQSTPDYFQADSKPGDYFPAVINFIPNSSTATATATAPPNATTVAPSVTIPPTQIVSESTAPQVQVKGNSLVDVKTGEPIRLIGADRDGSEYPCEQGWGFTDGPTDLPTFMAMKSWGLNSVRVPLNEHCWLGLTGIKPELAGNNYKAVIAQIVSNANKAGLVVILDLHESGPKATTGSNPEFVSGNNGQQRMADADYSPQFWSDVASIYGQNLSVVLDLFNEPFNIDWNCWKLGCQATATDNSQYQAAGMQQLVAAVRSKSAKNVLMLGGLSWASDETQWEANKPEDPLNQLAVSFHLYQFGGCLDASCWESRFNQVYQKYPVIAGEIGNTDCQVGFINSILPWMDSKSMSYLAWVWTNWTDCQPLISDYSGTARQPYGQAYKDHVQQVISGTTAPIQTQTTPAPASPTSTAALSIVTPTVKSTEAAALPTATASLTATEIPPTQTLPTTTPGSTALTTQPITSLPSPTPIFTQTNSYTIPNSLNQQVGTTIAIANMSQILPAYITVGYASGKKVPLKILPGKQIQFATTSPGTVVITSDQKIVLSVVSVTIIR